MGAVTSTAEGLDGRPFRTGLPALPLAGLAGLPGWPPPCRSMHITVHVHG